MITKKVSRLMKMMIESIEVCYLVKGNTENSADTVHGMIKGAKVSNVQLSGQ